MKNELKKLRKILDSEYPENVSEELTEDEKVTNGADDGKRNSNREAFLTITLNALGSMKEEQLAASLQNSKILMWIISCLINMEFIIYNSSLQIHLQYPNIQNMRLIGWDLVIKTCLLFVEWEHWEMYAFIKNLILHV